MNEGKNNRGVTVVTGQQIGLLGGPLYTVYKVLGAVFLARELNGKAVYWLETNDADFNEINHIDYLDAEGRLQTLTWDIDSRGFSCGYIEVDDSLVSLLKTFFSTIRRTEFTPALEEMALDAYAEGRTLADASKRLASHLFGQFGIELFIPFDPGFMEFMQPILRKEAERTREGEQCNCFCMMGKQRKALFRKGDGFQLRDGSPVDLGAHPLVPNVKTRSLCQDAYFNTHTYIAGPGEVKYLAELDPVFEFHGVKKEAVQPRMMVTLLEPRVKRLLKKTGITLEEVLGTAKEELLKKAITTGTGYDLNDARKEADALTTDFLEKLRVLGLDEKDMKLVGKSVREEMKNAFGRLRAREKEKQDDRLREIASLSDGLMPFGQRQERVFNIFYYLNLYGGREFIDWLYAHYDFDRESLEIEHLK